VGRDNAGRVSAAAIEREREKCKVKANERSSQHWL